MLCTIRLTPFACAAYREHTYVRIDANNEVNGKVTAVSSDAVIRRAINRERFFGWRGLIQQAKSP
jgi:hypothetical protein